MVTGSRSLSEGKTAKTISYIPEFPTLLFPRSWTIALNNDKSKIGVVPTPQSSLDLALCRDSDIV